MNSTATDGDHPRRNSPCPCGSGKKYKQCCLQQDARQRVFVPSTAVDISNILQTAIAHHKAGRLPEAEDLYRQILKIKPSHPDALHLFGLVASQNGKYEIALELIGKAIKLMPNFAEAHNNLGSVLLNQGKLAEASTCFHRSIRLNPDFAEAHNNIGNIFKIQGKLDQAIICYSKAIALKPEYAEAHSNLGSTFLRQGKLDDAIINLLYSIRLKPDFAEAYYNLGYALGEQGKLDDAVSCYRQAIKLKPDSAEAHNNLALILQAQGKLDDAASSFQAALAQKPDYAESHSNLGITLQAQGRMREAANSFLQALRFRPDFAAAHSNLLLAMQYLNEATPDEIFAAHKRYADIFEAPQKSHWQIHRNSRDPDRPIKVGYVSGDFFNHSVAFFIEPILASHDKTQVEIYCYYNNTKHDSHTERIASYADHWLPSAGMSDDQLVERIRADGIDILVDLSGHSGYNRLPVFARKPAPVQATWIGYAATTGLTAMDYRITDAQLDPPGMTERYHTEVLIRLPDTGAAYRPEPGCPPVNQLPALSSGEFIFASLNNLAKINRSVVNLWGRILNELPHARLMLGNVTDAGIQQRLLEMFDQAGIGAERLILQPRMSIIEFLTMHNQIDITLDPFPYNGGTTTIHSLWMGVPAITLAGNSTVSRCGVALLSRVGLADLISHSEEEYLQRAVQLAHDLSGLNEIRQSLRERMGVTSSNPETITRHLESAYRNMWRTWCAA